MNFGKPNPPANHDVFINCPFDSDYEELFHALCFTIVACGFVPRCALEHIDSGEVRLEKIRRIIASSALGVHDISRTELSTSTNLPRFNMPFELGLFLGSKFYGPPAHRSKKTLILDRERYRFQQFLSDIGGQDPEAHHGDTARAIEAVRNWLQCSTECVLDGPLHLMFKFQQFRAELPRMAFVRGWQDEHTNFSDLIRIMRRWLYLQRLAE